MVYILHKKELMIIKTENKIIIYSILAAVSFGFVDAAIDTYILGRGSFFHTLFFAADKVYFRLLGAVFFLSFGIIIFRIFAAKSLIEKELLQSEARFRSLVESTDDSIQPSCIDELLSHADKLMYEMKRETHRL